jgi:hypothetical protein
LVCRGKPAEGPTTAATMGVRATVPALANRGSAVLENAPPAWTRGLNGEIAISITMLSAAST